MSGVGKLVLKGGVVPKIADKSKNKKHKKEKRHKKEKKGEKKHKKRHRSSSSSSSSNSSSSSDSSSSEKKRPRKVARIEAEHAQPTFASPPPLSASSEEIKIPGEEWMTPAERSFALAQAVRKREIAAKMGSKTHQEKVQEFNAYLGKLPEHHDIPKVGPG